MHEGDLRIVSCIVQDVSATFGLNVSSLVDRIAPSRPRVRNLKQDYFRRQVRRIVRQRGAGVGTEVVKIEGQVVFAENWLAGHEAEFLRLGRIRRSVADSERCSRLEDGLNLILHSTGSADSGANSGGQSIEESRVTVVTFGDEHGHACLDDPCYSNGDRFLCPARLTASRIIE